MGAGTAALVVKTREKACLTFTVTFILANSKNGNNAITDPVPATGQNGGSYLNHEKLSAVDFGVGKTATFTKTRV